MMEAEYQPRGEADPEPWAVGHERFATEDEAQRFIWAHEESERESR